MKPITAIIVLILVASLVAGCVNITFSGNNHVSTAYPTAGRSELLQGIEASYNESAANNQYEDYNVTWMNNTTITVHTVTTSATEVTTWDYKFTHYPTIEGATAYFDSHRLLYTYNETVDHASLYAHVTGVKNSSVSKEVTIDIGNTTYYFEQIDSLIIESSLRVLSPVSATAEAIATPLPPQLSQAQLNAI